LRDGFTTIAKLTLVQTAVRCMKPVHVESLCKVRQLSEVVGGIVMTLFRSTDTRRQQQQQYGRMYVDET